jgi:hypothetical protein
MLPFWSENTYSQSEQSVLFGVNTHTHAFSTFLISFTCTPTCCHSLVPVPVPASGDTEAMLTAALVVAVAVACLTLCAGRQTCQTSVPFGSTRTCTQVLVSAGAIYIRALQYRASAMHYTLQNRTTFHVANCLLKCRSDKYCHTGTKPRLCDLIDSFAPPPPSSTHTHTHTHHAGRIILTLSHKP